MLKRIKAAVLISFFTGFIIFFSCLNAYGSDLQKEGSIERGEYDKENVIRRGWEKESMLLRYKDDDGAYLKGWNYLPSYDDQGALKWFFFNKGGYMLSSFDPGGRVIRSGLYCYEPLVSSIPYKYHSVTNYEPAVLEQGWYEISVAADNTKDKSKADYLWYIKNCGNNEYSINVFNGGAFTFLGRDEDAKGHFAFSFKEQEDAVLQKWSVVKNSDGSFSFIDPVTGLALEAAESGMTLSLYEKGKTAQMMYAGERREARPEYYGAAGDGYADDTQAIRYAVDNNSHVVFSGRYNTSECIGLTSDGLVLEGDGGMIVTHPGFSVFEVKGKNITFDSMRFEGNYTTAESTNNSCIYFRTRKGDDPVVDYNTMIRNCSFIKTGLRGIHFHSERVSETDFTPVSIISNITVKDCDFDTYTIGVCCSGPDNVRVDHCTFKNARYEHVTFDWRTRYSVLENSYLEGPDSGVGCVGIDAGEDCVVKDNKIKYSRFYGITLNNETGVNKNIVIEGNTFEYSGGDGGVHICAERDLGVAAENVTITDNTFYTGSSNSVILDSAEGSIEFSGNDYHYNTPVINDMDARIIKDF